MPNWCQNNLTVIGDKKVIKKLSEVVKKDNKRSSSNIAEHLPKFVINNNTILKEVLESIKSKNKYPITTGLLDFFHPMPTVFFATVRGSHPPEWQKTYQENLIKYYGCEDWYDWCTKNWSTKWDVFSDDITILDESYTKHKGRIEIEFNTAWSPPEKAVERWTKYITHYTNDNLNKCLLTYIEPGVDFCGFLDPLTNDEYDTMVSNFREIPDIEQKHWLSKACQECLNYFDEDEDDAIEKEFKQKLKVA